MPRVTIRRAVEVPDPIRVARAERAPEVGPRILFFSGGTAIRDLSRELVALTHRSIHLITPFDSGGSSATLRRAFAMISVGDLRNRLVALADTRIHGHPSVVRLFSHRFPAAASEACLRTDLAALVDGRDPLVASIPAPLRRLCQSHLGFFARAMPEGFDLRGASVGNLILVGGYLNNERDIDAVIFLFSKLVEARGLVRPVVAADLHLAADLDDGRVVLGQHRITGGDGAPLGSPIRELRLTERLDRLEPASVDLDERTRRWIEQAELIVFPMGSFFTSVLACLLPRGAAEAIRGAGCPKVYVPSCGFDPELHGLGPAAATARLLAALGARPGHPEDAPGRVDLVLVDARRGDYRGGLDLAAIERLGVQVLDCDLAGPRGEGLLDARPLAEALVSLA